MGGRAPRSSLHSPRFAALWLRFYALLLRAFRATAAQRCAVEHRLLSVACAPLFTGALAPPPLLGPHKHMDRSDRSGSFTRTLGALQAGRRLSLPLSYMAARSASHLAPTSPFAVGMLLCHTRFLLYRNTAAAGILAHTVAATNCQRWQLPCYTCLPAALRAAPRLPPSFHSARTFSFSCRACTVRAQHRALSHTAATVLLITRLRILYCCTLRAQRNASFTRRVTHKRTYALRSRFAPLLRRLRTRAVIQLHWRRAARRA